MSELSATEIARVTLELEPQAREGVFEGTVLTGGDGNGFQIGVLAAIKTIKAAGGELPSEEELIKAIPEGVKETSKVMKKASAYHGRNTTGPEALYVRI